MSSPLSPQLVLVYNSLASVGVGSLFGSLHFHLVFVYTEAWLRSELESTLNNGAGTQKHAVYAFSVTTVLLAHSACQIGYTKQQM